jgi:hypothetical protein
MSRSAVPRRHANDEKDRKGYERHPGLGPYHRMGPRARLVDSENTLTPAEEKIVRRGEAQLKRGESKPWSAVKRALSR